jgi:hypothetical protein
MKLIQNFKFLLDVNAPQKTHHFSHPLVELFNQILILKNVALKDSLMTKMYTLVHSNLRIFLPDAESVSTLESNIEVLHLLKHVQYYDDTEKKIELYNCEVEKITKQFQIFCIMKADTKKLHKVITKILRPSEIEIIIANSKLIQQDSVKVDNIDQFMKDHLSFM